VPGTLALVYFSLLGVGFMLVEIEMFHVFALALGSPTYAFSTVLASLLVFSGLGSTQTKRISAGGGRALAMAFGALIVLLGGFTLLKGPLLAGLVAAPFWLRIVGTVIAIAPVAFAMGLPMAL